MHFKFKFIEARMTRMNSESGPGPGPGGDSSRRIAGVVRL
jgi:hypothetical protein